MTDFPDRNLGFLRSRVASGTLGADDADRQLSLLLRDAEKMLNASAGGTLVFTQAAVNGSISAVLTVNEKYRQGCGATFAAALEDMLTREPAPTRPDDQD